MTRGRRAYAFVPLATLTLALAGSAAHAQSAEAEALFREGRRQVKAGSIAAGCDKLDASARLEPSVGTLLNLGDCREKLGKLASAWAAFRKAEAMARYSSGDDNKRGAEARRRAAALEPKLSTLAIEVSGKIEGMTVRRDDELVDPAAWGTPMPVDPGSYAIIVEAPGYKPWRSEVKIEPGARRQSIAVPALERAPIVVPPPPPREVEPAAAAVTVKRGTWTKTRGVAVALGVLGAGAIGGGAYFAVRSRDLEDQANERCPLVVCTDAEALRLNDRARTYAVRADVGFVAGGVALATGAVMWLVGTPGDTKIVPVADKGGLGVQFARRF